jgi:hypothetical protein
LQVPGDSATQPPTSCPPTENGRQQGSSAGHSLETWQSSTPDAHAALVAQPQPDPESPQQAFPAQSSGPSQPMEMYPVGHALSQVVSSVPDASPVQQRSDALPSQLVEPQLIGPLPIGRPAAPADPPVPLCCPLPVLSELPQPAAKSSPTKAMSPFRIVSRT